MQSSFKTLCLSWIWLTLSILTLAQTESTEIQEDRTEIESEEPVSEQMVVYGPDDQKLIATEVGGATKIEAPLATTPLSISVLTGQRLRDFGAQTVQDTLVYSSGVHSGVFGVDPRGDWSTVRGVAPATYVDGLRLLFGNYNNTRPSTYSLSRVEILKGPSSVMYGQGSTGGIVNLVSKLPKDRASQEVLTTFGSFERKQANLDFTGPLDDEGRWLYRVVGLLKDSESQTDFVDDNAWLLSPSLTWKASDQTKITLLGSS